MATPDHRDARIRRTASAHRQRRRSTGLAGSGSGVNGWGLAGPGARKKRNDRSAATCGVVSHRKQPSGWRRYAATVLLGTTGPAHEPTVAAYGFPASGSDSLGSSEPRWT